MTDRWSWAVRYAVVMILALILGAMLGGMELFRTTPVIRKDLTASHLVRFLGYGGGLAVFWLLAQRATAVLTEEGERWRVVQQVLLPLATLIVVSAAYDVLLLVLNPLMDRALRQIYNWLFIGGVVASASWLVIALFNDSSLARSPGGASGPHQPAEAKCASCGAPLPSNARYCSQCGGAVGGSADAE